MQKEGVILYCSAQSTMYSNTILPFYNSVCHQRLTQAKMRTASWKNVDKQMPCNTKLQMSMYQMI